MSTECVAAAVARASALHVGGEAALLAGLEACAAASSGCLRSSLAEHGVAAAAVLCGLPSSGDCQSEEPLLLPAGLGSHAWTLAASYGTVQLVAMPWFFLWIFSSSVLGWVHFLRMQWHILRMGVDFLAMVALWALIAVEGLLGGVALYACSWASPSRHKRARLESQLRRAASLDEHLAAELALGELERASAARGCRRRPNGRTCEHGEWLGTVLQSGLEGELRSLEPLLLRHAGGVDWPHVPQGAEHLKTVAQRLEECCEARLRPEDGGASKEELLVWLRQRQRQLGCTALCLSGGGSLAMIHMGVCRFLLEEGTMPQVISGVSGGSIVAGFLAIHTDAELLDHVLVPEIVSRHGPDVRWFPPFLSEVVNFLKLGVLVPTESFERTCQAFFGSWTFEEAFARTGRHVSVVISSNFSRKLPACVMLNHVTAPHVTIASAVATSCAAMGIMCPRGLASKSSSGELTPFDVLGKSFADGTFTAEVPKDYLRSAFGVNQFIVSQVNPHVSSFMNAEGGGVLMTLRSYFGQDLQTRARLLSESHLLPSFFGRAMCNATKHLSQDFQELNAGLTLFPPDLGLDSIKAAVSNPSVKDMGDYILTGQRMAWRKADEIRARMRTEAALAVAMQRAEGRSPNLTLDPNQPPPAEPRAPLSALPSGTEFN